MVEEDPTFRMKQYETNQTLISGVKCSWMLSQPIKVRFGVGAT